MKSNFSWKKKTAIFIGRFQPFHAGHKKLFTTALKRSGQVAILVMDAQNIGIKNPYSFNNVKKKIYSNLKKYKKKFIIIKIPYTDRLIYGRKVGYKIQKIKVVKSIEDISATNLRKNNRNRS